MTDANIALKPCPFCGGRGLSHRVPTGWRMSCTQCDARPIKGLPPATEAEAIAAWNQRTSPTPPDDVVERVARDSEGKVLICTGCGSTDTVEWLRQSRPGTLSCCPERKMVRAALTAVTPQVDRDAELREALTPPHKPSASPTPRGAGE